MYALASVAMFFQDEAGLAHDVHLLMFAQWIMAICMLVIILALVIAGVAVLVVVGKAQKKIESVTKVVESRGYPLIAQGQDLMTKVQEIVADLKPKIASISSDVTHISGVVKNKVDEAGQTFTSVNHTVQDVNGKTKAQVQRVNGMVSEALSTTEHVSRTIQHGIRVPVQAVAGWVAAAKAGVETLAAKTPFWHKTTATPRPAPAASASSPARTTGSAAPGGPPFVAAPDAPRRTS